jgi:hypothetical protein
MKSLPAAWPAQGPVRPFDPAWRRLLHSAGGRWAVAAGLVLLVALALATVLEPHWREAASELDARPRPEPAGGSAPSWPPAEAHASRVGALLGLARRHGVRVHGLREEKAIEPRDPTAGGAVWRPVTISAEGSYAALRGFAASALAADAALAMDHLVLQRADTGQALLRAEFGLALGHAAPTKAPVKTPVPAPRPNTSPRPAP